MTLVLELEKEENHSGEKISDPTVLALLYARLLERTKNMVEQERLINHIVRSVRSSLDLETILGTVTTQLGAALEADRCQIVQPHSESPLIVTYEFCHPDIRSAKGVKLYSDRIDFNPLEPEQNLKATGNCLLGIDLDHLAMSSHDDKHIAPVVVITNVDEDKRTDRFQQFFTETNTSSLIAAPLWGENRLLGLLLVHQCFSTRRWTTSEIKLVSAVADQLAVAITHANLYQQVKFQSITDGLTGLYNHVYFKNRLAEELRISQRKKTPCSLLMLDLDNLKQINDTFGHPVGDAAIRQTATILKTILRSGDTAARYGGEEFGVILPQTGIEEARLIADRICTYVRNSKVPGLETRNISVSIGAACYPKDAADVVDLIKHADDALYFAKNGGRNQVCLFE
jgi:diguanylate cyclase (GGDEF)-like protein